MMACQENTHQITLGYLLKDIAVLEASVDRNISGLSQDSRSIQKGDLFIACRGRTFDAAEFIDAAIAAGAEAVVWEPDVESEFIQHKIHITPDNHHIPLIAVPGLSFRVGVIADRFYGHPSRQMYVIGITGTNGKTSCSQFLGHLLSQDAPCGIIGTLGNGLYGKLDHTSHTTPDAVRCHALMAEMLAQGAQTAVMEVSSHALDQGRVIGIDFNSAIFTNLTHEHLDYHGNMENYASAKRKLFQLDSLDKVVINHDDSFGRQLIKDVSAHRPVLSYGMEQDNGCPDVFADELQLNTYGLSMQLHTAWGNGLLQAPVLGRFNASNLLAVVAALLVRNMPLDEILQRISAISPVAGRMQTLQHDKTPLVVIDYAHTPDALEHVLNACREHTEGKLICVFGCGGNRDRVKRPMMGEIAERLADRVVLTNDNPRHEAPDEIIDEILKGMRAPDLANVIEDRASAIRQAIEMATPGDIVLVAGKGHETYQQIGDTRMPFSDVQVAGLILQEQR